MASSQKIYLSVDCCDYRRVKDLACVAAKISSALAQSSYRPIRELLCDCDNGAVVISGRLPTYYLRQVVNALAMSVLPNGVLFESDIEVT